MGWQSTALALAAAIVLPTWCGRSGLRRLEPDASLPGFEIPAAAAAGALCGLAEAHLSQNGELLSAATVILCGFLAAAAVVDWRTAWAPTELVLPVCIAAGLSAAADGCSLSVLMLSSAAVGGGLFLTAWALFALQARAGRNWFPPADTIAMAVPLILLESNLAGAMLCFAVAAILLAAKHLPAKRRKGGSGRIALPDGKVALLAVAFPALVLCMLAESLIVRAVVGASAFNG